MRVIIIDHIMILISIVHAHALQHYLLSSIAIYSMIFLLATLPHGGRMRS